MKKIAILLTLVMTLGLLAGCAGTPVVYYTECNCNTNAGVQQEQNQEQAPEVIVEGAVKTGIAVIGNAGDSKDATEVAYDVTIVGVTVDDNGVIQSCIIDGLGAKVGFDAAGAITAELAAPLATKNELGENYGMVAWGGAIAEWNEQAASFAQYITGKTAEEVAGIAINESTKPADGTDLASSVTISIGGFQALIAKAMQG